MAKAIGCVTAPAGFRAAGICCGIKRGRKDLALIVSDISAAAAGTFTTNCYAAAPVVLSRGRLRAGRARAIVVNSGCANACTGEKGARDAERVTSKAAGILGIEPEEVLAASTGRIGCRLPVERIEKGLEDLAARLGREGGADAAVAILTTDSCPKEAVETLAIDDREITIGAMAKGSGMIMPEMATMLCFITTDAAVSPGCLRHILRESVEKSFNRISVDGETSTNDSVFLLANGLAKNRTIEEPDSPEGRLFAAALGRITGLLAEKIVRDGEGASKFLEIIVRGARSQDEAKRLGFAIANSPLFKSAMYGEEPNWGRILSALGAAGVDLEPERVRVLLQGETVFNRGSPGGADEEVLRALIRGEDIAVEVFLERGSGEARILGCDLSPHYVDINSA